MMASSQNLTAYDDNGTITFNVSDCHLAQFITTIDKIEGGGYDIPHGIYKLKVDEHSRTTGTNPQNLLRIVGPHLKSNCVLQVIKKYPLCNSALGYRAHTPRKTWYLEDFASKMKNVSTYSGLDTCCVEVLKSFGDTKALLRHWLKEAEDFGVEARSQRCSKPLNIELNEEENRKLLEHGHELRAEYEKLLSSNTYSSECKKVKPVSTVCSCVDCFTESEDESFSEEEGKKSKRKFEYPESVLSKFPRYATGIQLAPKQNIVQVTQNFSLSNITSVLDLLPSIHRGLQIPYFYVGETHSSFAAHTEDASLYAANYLHFGFPKIWVTVSAEFCDKVRHALKTLQMDLVHTSCVNSLSHKYYLFTLKMFEDLNIPFHVTVQNEGEMVILQPNTIHYGWNGGPCVAEAVNFGSISWIPEGVKSLRWRCRCYGDESIHLDLNNLVAAFFPEMLLPAASNEEPTQGVNILEEVEVSENPSKELLKKRSIKTYKCTDPECNMAFQDHRQRLVDHITKVHESSGPDVVNKLLDDLERKYPKRNKENPSGLVCKVCGQVIAGSSTHLENHYRRKVNCPTLKEDLKAKYLKAYQELQSMVKRRKKTVKQNKT